MIARYLQHCCVLQSSSLSHNSKSSFNLLPNLLHYPAACLHVFPHFVSLYFDESLILYISRSITLYFAKSFHVQHFTVGLSVVSIHSSYFTVSVVPSASSLCTLSVYCTLHSVSAAPIQIKLSLSVIYCNLCVVRRIHWRLKCKIRSQMTLTSCLNIPQAHFPIATSTDNCLLSSAAWGSS